MKDHIPENFRKYQGKGSLEIYSLLVLYVTKNILGNGLFLIYRFESFAKLILQHLCFVCMANLSKDTLKIDYGKKQ